MLFASPSRAECSLRRRVSGVGLTTARKLKSFALASGEQSGVSRLLLNSRWRQNRLLILCYHGCSLADEHLWDGALYMSPDRFEDRMKILRDLDCNILPLGKALELMAAGALPPRSVVLTFDDGNYDFYAKVFPILQKFGFPATVYFPTAYSEFQRPVFNVSVNYLLWRAQSQKLRWPQVLGSSKIRLSDHAQRDQTALDIIRYSKACRLSIEEKDDMLVELNSRLNGGLDEIRARRMFYSMTPAEVRKVVAAGIDMQLHTHNHVVSRYHGEFQLEIEENRQHVVALGGEGSHFCYPNGFCLDAFPGWLSREGIASATTCVPGIASKDTDPYRLPRLCDSMFLSDTAFSTWVSGLASMLPSRSLKPNLIDMVPEWMPAVRASAPVPGLLVARSGRFSD